MRHLRLLSVAVTVVVAVAVAACGSGSSGPLAQTADNVGKVKSGVLDLRLTAAAGEQPTGEEAGFRLEGPFAEGAKGHLPVADMTYTQLQGRREQTVKVVTTGDRAYVVRNGRGYVLSAAQANQLKVSGGSGIDLHLDRWFSNPKVTDAGTTDGVAVQRITGRLNTSAALDDLFRLSRSFGASDVNAPQIKGDLAKRLDAAIQSASAEVVTGKADHFLRHLVVDVKLRSQAPARIRQALGRLSAVRFHFELGLSKPNRPVHVTAPPNPLPASDLPSN
ncbi:MAG: hypothetical protein JWP02_1330 [Acidimicrobiales bacterium]|nr:hypothetical protein [Acidimicrobiales bacterium]